MTCFIYFFKIYCLILQLYSIHSTTYIDSYNIRANLICDCHGRPNCTTFSSMDIRHNPHFASPCQIIITHSSDLLDCFIFNHLCITNRCCNFSLYFKHIIHILSHNPSLSLLILFIMEKKLRTFTAHNFFDLTICPLLN